MKTRYFEPPPPRVVAHRGFAARCPENTLPAFEAAAAFTKHFELDVWWTADRVLVVHHDETLQRTCNDPRPIHALTRDELRPLDAGRGFAAPDGTRPWRGRQASIPALQDVFRRFPDQHYIVEIKHDIPGIEEAVAALARNEGLAGRILIASEHDAVVERARAAAPNIPTNLGTGEIVRFVLWLEAGRPGIFETPARALQIPGEARGRSLGSPGLIAAAHAAGLEVHYWTINAPDDMRRLLAMGADALITDDPALAAGIVGNVPAPPR